MWRKARELAAKKGKSLSALIREQLEALTQEKNELKEVTEEILTIMQEHSGTLTNGAGKNFMVFLLGRPDREFCLGSWLSRPVYGRFESRPEIKIVNPFRMSLV